MNNKQMQTRDNKSSLFLPGFHRPNQYSMIMPLIHCQDNLKQLQQSMLGCSTYMQKNDKEL